MNKHLYHAAILLGLLALFAIGFGVRYAVLDANERKVEGSVPFTLESALQFRTTKMVYTGEGIPAHDPMIQYPEGIEVFRTDTVMAEYLYAAGARLLPSSLPLETRVRWITLAWFSLSIPLMALWVTAWTRTRSGGVVAALFYAVALSSVIRSTGLELSRENFALPFLVAHLALDAWALRWGAGRRFYGAVAGSALCLGLALAAWDMIQFYLLLWVVVLFIHSVLGRLDTPCERLRWLVPAGAIILVAVLSPYHRAHGLWAAPFMWLIYGVFLHVLWSQWKPLGMGARMGVTLLPLAAYLLIPHGYGESYGHFVELLTAKIRFLNQKPADPSVLTFNQRIMWTPALNSATWRLTWMFFPAMVPFVIVSLAHTLFSKMLLRPTSAVFGNSAVPHYIFFLCVSCIAFVLFVRFHVFVALFAAAWLGGWWAWPLRRTLWSAAVIWPLLVLGLSMEAVHVLEEPGRWGRVSVYYEEERELTEWMNEEAEGNAVLANFGISASILAYGGCPIILHPKFETRAIRERVASYGKTLFTENEEAFRDWADERGAVYYVYAMGEFARSHPELQMRYFVDALEPPDHAAARQFEFAPDSLRYFEYLWGNRKYQVFRLIPREDEERAYQLTARAGRAMTRGDLDRAETYAWAALALFPGQQRAQEIIAQATALRQQGFEYQPEE